MERPERSVCNNNRLNGLERLMVLGAREMRMACD